MGSNFSCCSRGATNASDAVPKGRKLPVALGQEDTQKGETQLWQVNITTLAADDGESDPMGAMIRQGLDQSRQMKKDEKKGHGPFNGDVEAWMEFRKNLSNQNDAGEIRFAKTLPPKCKQQDPARLCLQFLESKKAEPENSLAANNQEEDGDLTPIGRAIRQGGHEIRQRQFDEAHGFEFNDHSEWKAWDEKQPPANSHGCRNGTLAADDGEYTPVGAMIRQGRDQLRQMKNDEAKGHGPFNGDVEAWMEFRKNLSNQDDAGEIRLAKTLPPQCKRKDPARLCLQFLESKKAEPENSLAANNQEEDGDLTPMGRAIKQGQHQIRQRHIDECNGFEFNDHSEWMAWDAKQPPADSHGRRPIEQMQSV